MSKKEKNVFMLDDSLKEIMCNVCSTPRLSIHFPRTRLGCQHSCCRQCLSSYFKERINAGVTNITCPWNGCDQAFSPGDIYKILKNQTWIDKYTRLTLVKLLMTNSETRFCPGMDCEYAVFVPRGIECPVLKCEHPRCGVRFCCHCRESWSEHHKCKARQRLPDTKHCPGCKAPVHKIDYGCNEMKCRICGKTFCWLCLKDLRHGDHFGIECPSYGKKTYGKGRRIAIKASFAALMALGIPLATVVLAGTVMTFQLRQAIT